MTRRRVLPIARKNKLERFLEEHEAVNQWLSAVASQAGRDRLAYETVEKTVKGFCDDYERWDMIKPLLKHYQNLSGYRTERKMA